MGMKIVYIRADRFDSTPAIPRAVQAASNNFDDIVIYCWNKSGNIPNTEPSLEDVKRVRRFKKEVSSTQFYAVFQLLLFQCWCIGQLIQESADIVQPVSIYTALPVIVLSAVIDIDVVYDIRDPFAWFYNGNWLTEHTAKALDGVVARKSDAVIIPNKELKDYLVCLGASEKPIFCFPHTPPDQIGELKIHKSFVYKKEKVQLAYVGYISSDRAKDWLLRFANNQDNHFELVVASNIANEKLLKQLHQNENVQFLGGLSRENALYVMMKTDAVLILYDPDIKVHRYMCPVKFYDSMMLGVPVIVTKGMDMLEDVVLRNQLGKVVEYENDSDLALAISEIKKDKVRKKLSGKCREYYNSNCDVHKLIDEYAGFYANEVVKGGTV